MFPNQLLKKFNIMNTTKVILYSIQLESSEFPEILYIENSKDELMKKLPNIIGKYFETHYKDQDWRLVEESMSPKDEYIEFIMDGFNWCNKVRDINAYGDSWFVIDSVRV